MNSRRKFGPRLVSRTLSCAMAFMGLYLLTWPLIERLPERLELNPLILPEGTLYLARSLDVLIGGSLLFCAYQLLRRKRAAWYFALCGTIALIILRLPFAHSSIILIILALIVLTLLLNRNYFLVRTEPTSLKRAGVILTLSLSGALVYGVVGFYFMDPRDFGQDFSFRQSIANTIAAYLQLGTPSPVPLTHRAHWFLDSLGLIGSLSVGISLYNLFRPLAYRLKIFPEEILRVRSILGHWSKSSEDFFKIWPHDKSYLFTDGNNAVAAYTVSHNVALMVGDPVGQPSALPQLIKSINELCIASDWRACWLYLGPDLLIDFRHQGLTIAKIGEDAIVDLDTFVKSTSRNKHFRNIMNRFSNQGYTATRYNPPHSRSIISELTAVSKAWLSQPGRHDWRFIAGSFSPGYIQQASVFVVRDGKGKVQAFVNELPVFASGQTSVDLMRFRPGIASGLMDYLFLKLFIGLHETGHTHFNLGLAPLSGLSQPKARPEERLLGLIYRLEQPWLSFKGLRQFKNKFEPKWASRYIAYTGGPASLPQIALALSAISAKK